MIPRKRHDVEEVAAKLQKAAELAATGKNQQAIARELGVSVMTIHRWKKRYKENTGPRLDKDSLQAGFSGNEEFARVLKNNINLAAVEKNNIDEEIINQIKELEVDNARLRRLVADLLLEKVKLEDELREVRGVRIRPNRQYQR